MASDGWDQDDLARYIEEEQKSEATEEEPHTGSEVLTEEEFEEIFDTAEALDGAERELIKEMAESSKRLSDLRRGLHHEI